MLTQTEQDRLLDAMNAFGVAVLDLQDGENSLRLTLEDGLADRLADGLNEGAGAQLDIVRPARAKIPAQSPCIGLFVPRGDTDGLATLTTHSIVAAGDTLGYVAQDRVLALIVAPAAGRLVSDVPARGTVLGYGDIVFQLEAIS